MTIKRLCTKCLRWCVSLLLLMMIIAIGKTFADFTSPITEFRSAYVNIHQLQILDRDGQPLEFSYQNHWNVYDNIQLHQLPELLINAFIISEDKRFFEHSGVDWIAKSNAILQRFGNGQSSRGGASTITEQVVRMLHHRKRTIWSKWIESLEAITLELSANKADILEFYLNQVPYRSNRRGVVQAARFYFNRDLSTLNAQEMLALVILVRAPSRFDLYNSKIPLGDSILRLAKALAMQSLIDREVVENLGTYDLQLSPENISTPAFHFINFIKANEINRPLIKGSKIITTLDSHIQIFVTDMLESRLQSLLAQHVNNAAAIVIDNHTHEILAWTSVGAQCKATMDRASGCMIDMVLAPRQPGSALKPFLYAAALEKNWNAATVIDDAPYSDAIGKGIKHFHNYSNIHYGKVRLRTALGNSLNIPALHTINYVTPRHYLTVLHDLGFQNLHQGAEFYDDGLALGNGEVSLLELARAYTTLANRGVFEPLRSALYTDISSEKRFVYSEEVASLIGNILSDPWARSLEFGRGSVLNFPTQTAVKTGTSTDYRDAWAIGYDSHYTVGIWMGNADYSPTDGITGALGPSLTLRGIFNELSKNAHASPLFLSPKLEAREICLKAEDAQSHNSDCLTYTEYFVQNKAEYPITNAVVRRNIHILRPPKDLEIAFDPRIPYKNQMFEMRLAGVLDTDKVEWSIDNIKYPIVNGSRFLWLVSRGSHTAEALVWRDGALLANASPTTFLVK